MIPVSSHPSARRPAGTRTRIARAVVAVALTACVAGACGGDDHTSDASTTIATSAAPSGAVEPRPLNAAESQQLASFRRRAYEAGVRSVDAVIASDATSVQIRGWIDTVDHVGYGMVTGVGVAPFLVTWTSTEVAAQAFTGSVPTLPIPDTGWERTALDHEASHLAAAQVMLLSLASNAPENPQLLRQSGATWLRADRVGDIPVDVMTGPIPEGATSSSYRYWIAPEGDLLRLEARLDGVHWSSFSFTDTPDVVFRD